MMEKRKPDWLKINIPGGSTCQTVKQIIRDNHLHTVCDSAKCPNKEECWSNHTATFMIMGDICTRNCRFCAVTSQRPLALDPEEPEHIAHAVNLLGLHYVVVTCVTRDDLPDGGAAHWAETILAIKKHNPECKVEILISDLQGSTKDIDTVLEAKPDVFGHNLETVARLYSIARPQASYQRSLDVIRYVSEKGFITKTGIMLGLGEKEDEVVSLMQDAADAGADVFTAGQYLQPTSDHLKVEDYIPPETFTAYKKAGLKVGLKQIVAGPLVRSSYRAEACYQKLMAKKEA